MSEGIPYTDGPDSQWPLTAENIDAAIVQAEAIAGTSLLTADDRERLTEMCRELCAAFNRPITGPPEVLASFTAAQLECLGEWRAQVACAVVAERLRVELHRLFADRGEA